MAVIGSPAADHVPNIGILLGGTPPLLFPRKVIFDGEGDDVSSATLDTCMPASRAAASWEDRAGVEPLLT